jgi:hypothetical protein
MRAEVLALHAEAPDPFVDIRKQDNYEGAPPCFTLLAATKPHHASAWLVAHLFAHVKASAVVNAQFATEACLPATQAPAIVAADTKAATI